MVFTVLSKQLFNAIATTKRKGKVFIRIKSTNQERCVKCGSIIKISEHDLIR